MNFPNGISGELNGSRGKNFHKTWNVTIFSVSLDKNFGIVEAEFGYAHNIYRLDRWGKVARIANGKVVTLCDDASLFPVSKRKFNRIVREWLYDTNAYSE